MTPATFVLKLSKALKGFPGLYLLSQFLKVLPEAIGAAAYLQLPDTYVCIQERNFAITFHMREYIHSLGKSASPPQQMGLSYRQECADWRTLDFT
jgi:hypothetical protein